jgi:hypothetical protein
VGCGSQGGLSSVQARPAHSPVEGWPPEPRPLFTSLRVGPGQLCFFCLLLPACRQQEEGGEVIRSAGRGAPPPSPSSLPRLTQECVQLPLCPPFLCVLLGVGHSRALSPSRRSALLKRPQTCRQVCHQSRLSGDIDFGRCQRWKVWARSAMAPCSGAAPICFINIITDCTVRSVGFDKLQRAQQCMQAGVFC